jgi:hypothetical protein
LDWIFKKQFMKKINMNFYFLIKLFFLMLFQIHFVLALPQKPQHPESESSFVTINNYYGLNQGLPHYSEILSTDTIKGDFIYRSVVLKIDSTLLKENPELHLILKIPNQLPIKSLPVICLFTGFQTGEQSVDLIENPGQNILMSIQYPMPINKYGETYHWHWDWSAFEAIPLLMTISLDWLRNQSYIDSGRINILSVSFGSIFTPLALRWLAYFTIPVRTVTLGYGGGDIPLIVGLELQKYMGRTETEIAKILLGHQTWIYEPKYHTPYLDSDFLIVHGQEDQVFPNQSKAIFDQIRSSKKSIVYLPGPHIQPDRPDLILNFIAAVQNFLLAKQAIN